MNILQVVRFIVLGSKRIVCTNSWEEENITLIIFSICNFLILLFVNHAVKDKFLI